MINKSVDYTTICSGPDGWPGCTAENSAVMWEAGGNMWALADGGKTTSSLVWGRQKWSESCEVVTQTGSQQVKTKAPIEMWIYNGNYGHTHIPHTHTLPQHVMNMTHTLYTHPHPRLNKHTSFTHVWPFSSLASSLLFPCVCVTFPLPSFFSFPHFFSLKSFPFLSFNILSSSLQFQCFFFFLRSHCWFHMPNKSVLLSECPQVYKYLNYTQRTE